MTSTLSVFRWIWSIDDAHGMTAAGAISVGRCARARLRCEVLKGSGGGVTGVGDGCLYDETKVTGRQRKRERDSERQRETGRENRRIAKLKTPFSKIPFSKSRERETSLIEKLLKSPFSKKQVS